MKETALTKSLWNKLFLLNVLLMSPHPCVADSSEADTIAMYTLPGSVVRSDAQLEGCHCNCTSNDDRNMVSIGFFPCDSVDCISCAPTLYDVCVAVFSDNDGNKDFGMYVCITDQDQGSATCLFNVMVPYFSCQALGALHINCQYDRGDEESMCLFRAPSQPIEDGCYPIASSGSDDSRVFCESADRCECLPDIGTPNSKMCLQRSSTSDPWGTCGCDVTSGTQMPVCGECGECPLNGAQGSGDSYSDYDGHEDDTGVSDTSTKNSAKVAGIVVPIVVIIIIAIVVGIVYMAKKRKLPDWMQRLPDCLPLKSSRSMSGRSENGTGSQSNVKCKFAIYQTCNELNALYISLHLLPCPSPPPPPSSFPSLVCTSKDMPIKRSTSSPETENPYQIDSDNDRHVYAGVPSSSSVKRQEEDGPLTNAREDTSGYLWYQGKGPSLEEDQSEQNKVDPGDGLLYYELEPSASESMKQNATPSKGTETPEYLEFEGEGVRTPEAVSDMGIETNTEGAGERVGNVVLDDQVEYGKLDRSQNRSEREKGGDTNKPDDEQYGHLAPNTSYETLNHSQAKFPGVADLHSGEEYGQLQPTEPQDRTAPPLDAIEPVDMPPSSEEVYGSL
ncbi:uncharacterized protein [Diadema setosum]|uniref:uncharacterized protein n=1 Tax=Diadema setosum TaxID=31175 RepID=UPI003B3B3566